MPDVYVLRRDGIVTDRPPLRFYGLSRDAHWNVAGLLRAIVNW